MFLLAACGWTGASAEVNVNKASASELAASLKNVGFAKAAAIVEYRKMHGAFKSVDELAEVHGIGEATVEMNRDQIILDDSQPAAGVSGVSGAADSAPGVPPGAPAASESRRMER